MSFTRGLLLAGVLAIAACAHRPGPVAGGTVTEARSLDPAARAALEAAAADADVTVRRLALAALVAADPAPGGGAWGPRGRYDPSEYVRRSVVDALGARGKEPESIELLRALAADSDPWVRGAAGLTLARAAKRGDIPREPVLALLTEAATNARGARSGAILLAAAVAGDSASEARLRDLLAAGNLAMEPWFFRALAADGGAAYAPALTEALDRVEPEIQLAVAEALLVLGSAAGEKVFTDALAGGDDDRAWEALELLGETSGAAAGRLLATVGDAHPDRRDAAVLVRYGRGDGATRDVLEALRGEDAELRRLAATVAGRRLRSDPGVEGADRLRTALREALPDAEPGLQLAVVDALGAAPTDADRATLTTVLGDESARLRVAAALGLAR